MLRPLLTVSLLILFQVFCSLQAMSLSIVQIESRAKPDPPLNKLLSIQPAAIEKPTGTKISILQKLQLKLLQRKLRKQLGITEEITEKQKRQARASMILGIGSIVAILIPYITLLCIPAAIIAIILGAKSLKGNSNSKGLIGVITGGVTILLIILALIIVAAFFSGW